jgi:hypothetical protein
MTRSIAAFVVCVCVCLCCLCCLCCVAFGCGEIEARRLLRKLLFLLQVTVEGREGYEGQDRSFVNAAE